MTAGRRAGRTGLLAAALATAGLLATGAVGCAGPPAAVPVPQISDGPSAPSAPPPAEPVQRRALPVYYTADTPAGPRLYREFHQVETADPASDAVLEMLSGDSGLDPDYRTHWPSTAGLRGPVGHSGGLLTVDLTGLGPGPDERRLAPLMVQQLVFTVQGAVQSTDPVRILVDGAPTDDLWGVRTADPVRRGDAMELRSLVQIDEPAEGAAVDGELVVSGEAAVFEATVLWEVLRDGEVVESGATSTSEGQVFAPYSFSVRLPRGEYLVRVSEDDPSGGEGRPVLTDDKAVTVD